MSQSQSHENAVLVRRAIDEIWNRENYALVDEFVASDLVIHGTTPSGDIHGPEGVRQFYSMLHAAFPDIHFTIEDQIAAGDRVVTRWTAHATHRGPFMDIPATEKQVSLTGIDIDRIVKGKVVECWPQADELGLLRQFGVVPGAE